MGVVVELTEEGREEFLRVQGYMNMHSHGLDEGTYHMGTLNLRDPGSNLYKEEVDIVYVLCEYSFIAFSMAI